MVAIIFSPTVYYFIFSRTSFERNLQKAYKPTQTTQNQKDSESDIEIKIRNDCSSIQNKILYTRFYKLVLTLLDTIYIYIKKTKKYSKFFKTFLV